MRSLNTASALSPLERVRTLAGSVRRAIWDWLYRRAALTCYAVEGAYPQSLDYLKTNYGITYNEDLFFVDYRISGANIFPDVTIIERSGAHASTETSETHH